MAELNDQERAELTKTMTEFSEGVTEDVKSQNAALGAVLRNQRGRTLRLYATHNWNGNVQSNPVGSINAGQTIQFLHVGPTPRGAVIYGEDRGGSNPAGYLLAWSMLNGPRRVYVKCGPLSEVHSNGWQSAALASLENARQNSTAQDDGTSSRATAQIRDESGTFPMSVVGANFG